MYKYLLGVLTYLILWGSPTFAQNIQQIKLVSANELDDFPQELSLLSLNFDPDNDHIVDLEIILENDTERIHHKFKGTKDKTTLTYPSGRYNLTVKSLYYEDAFYEDLVLLNQHHINVDIPLVIVKEYKNESLPVREVPLKAPFVNQSVEHNVVVHPLKWDTTITADVSLLKLEVLQDDGTTPLEGIKLKVKKLSDQSEMVLITDKEGKVSVEFEGEYDLRISAEQGTEKGAYEFGQLNFAWVTAEKGRSRRIVISLYQKKQEKEPRTITVPELKDRVSYKPVLYFYPMQEMDIDIELDVHGEFTFTYPEYSKGWSGKVYPNGEIKVGERTYPYLFWEGELESIAPEVEESGFVVKRENTITFFEEKLSYLGLNDREITDFITFWAPRLNENEQNFIHFVTGQAYDDQIAKLTLSKAPDTKIRVHLFYSGVNEKFTVPEQKLTKQIRKGFTVVEWGGGDIQLKGGL
ncbi:MAG: hypothetical protein MK212_04375 [Saprospiraceae bacterium]|nr:hypothetical protein [Saprospiraceae bacterium]